MRRDFAKVLTERPRRGSSSTNLKTGFHDKNYDDRESREDKYSLPTKGKMLMNNRELGPWSEEKVFTDHIKPLERFVKSLVGKNWDTVYGEIKKILPNTNKQNHHLVDTHLFDYIKLRVEVVKTPKGRKVFDLSRVRDVRYAELSTDDIYVDPKTHVIMRYRGGTPLYGHYRYRDNKTETGFIINKSDGNLYLEEKPEYYTVIEKRGPTWAYCRYDKHRSEISGRVIPILVEHHPLSKKELAYYGVKNDNPERRLPKYSRTFR